MLLAIQILITIGIGFSVLAGFIEYSDKPCTLIAVVLVLGVIVAIVWTLPLVGILIITSFHTINRLDKLLKV